MRNRSGQCGFEVPPWLEEALHERRENPRRYRTARSFLSYDNPDKRFFHLVDGGISDNLGLRPGIDLFEMMGDLEHAAAMAQTKLPNHVVVISVNAETDPDPSIDISSAAPGFASLMNAVSGGQIRRYNFETLLLMQQLLDGEAHRAKDAGRSLRTSLVEVSFEDFAEEPDRRYFKRIPTSFTLSDHQVDELIWAGRELLLDSTEYQRLVQFMGGKPAERTPRPVDD
jgi:NTE family protein